MKSQPIFNHLLCFVILVPSYFSVKGQQTFGEIAHMAALYDPSPMEVLAHDKSYFSRLYIDRFNDKPDNHEFVLVCHWKDMCVAKKSDKPTLYLVRKADILELDLVNKDPILNPDPQLLSLHLPSCESISLTLSARFARNSPRMMRSRQVAKPHSPKKKIITRGNSNVANLRSERLYVEKLTLDNFQHGVRRGETVISISEKYRVSPVQLMIANRLRSLDEIPEGEILKIPH